MKTVSSYVLLLKNQIIDAIISLDHVSDLLVRELNQVGPFGVGNEKPLFKFENIAPVSVELFGKTKEHTKLLFETQNGRLEAISFFQKPDEFQVAPNVGQKLSLLAHVEESFFMGRKQIRLRMVEVM